MTNNMGRSGILYTCMKSNDQNATSQNEMAVKNTVLRLIFWPNPQLMLHIPSVAKILVE